MYFGATKHLRLRTLLVISFVLLAQQLVGQSPTDSLKQLLSQTSSPAEQADLHMQIGDSYGRDDLDQAIKHYRQAEALHEKNNDLFGMARALDALGLAYFLKGEPDNAEQHYLGAIDLAKEAGRLYETIEYTGHLHSNVFLRSGRFAEALRRALDIRDGLPKDVPDSSQFAANDILIQVYFHLGDITDPFRDLCQENLEIAERMGDENLIEYAQFDLALAYGRMNQHQEAADMYRQYAASKIKKREFASASSAINNIAGRFRMLGDRDSARYYYQLGMVYSDSGNRPEGRAAAHLYIGQMLVEDGELEKGRLHCDSAHTILKDLSIIRRQYLCAQCIYFALKEQGRRSEALEYLELQIALEDSFMGRGVDRDIEILRKDHEFKLSLVEDSLALAHEREMAAEKRRSEQEQDRMEKIGLIVIAILVALLGLFAFLRFRSSQKQNAVIARQKLEVEQQKEQIDQAYSQLEEKNTEILDSINYARRIQSAILPPDRVVETHLSESFILYKPKDIVAGDFYWMEPFSEPSGQSGVLFAAADCTGHGVPGALVSVVCHGAMNRAVREFGLTDPGKILDKTREIVTAEFEKSKHEGESIKDGMDVALCSLVGRTLHYAGAHNPLWVIRKGSQEVEEIKGDKQPIGEFDEPTPFITHSVDLNPGDTIYVFSDGYSDQFGGDKGKKLKASNFRELLTSVQDRSMEHQKEHIDRAFEEWKGDLEQLDDVCVIGVRIS